MRPEFADFIRVIYGDSYEDHDETKNYPNIKGIESNLYYFKH